MKILLVSGHLYLPQYSGGVESSTHELALALNKRGHLVSVACKFSMQGLTGIRSQIALKITRKRYAKDNSLGYPVFRYWNVAKRLAETVGDIAPDVALVQIGGPVALASELRKAGVPTIVYLRNAEPNELGGDLRELHGVRYLANSTFIARFYKEMFDIEADVIPPLFEPERYLMKRSRSHVLFINPATAKGVDIALEIAHRCPEIPFRFLESWPMGEKHKAKLRAAIKDMPNVSFKTRTSDPKKIYSGAKIVLVPSKWQEAWGRVATEAQFSGIPVIASNRGGLPESVGPGGVLVDPDGPIEAWVDAVRRVWTDKSYYEALSEAALEYSRRPDINPARQIDSLIKLMQQVAT